MINGARFTFNLFMGLYCSNHLAMRSGVSQSVPHWVQDGQFGCPWWYPEGMHEFCRWYVFEW